MVSNIRVVMLNTSHPGNIGSAARAMKNMGLSRLYLVSPKEFPHIKATAQASGADDILENAVVTGSFDDALKNCQLVIGASARLRTVGVEVLTPQQCAQKSLMESKQGEVAIVFGNERTGMTNEELARCHCHVHVPTNPEFSSLNLAAAILLICYEIRNLQIADKELPKSNEVVELATADEMTGFFEHLQETLFNIEFLNPQQPRLLMRRLKRLFNRARVQKEEIHILRGILSKIRKKL